MSWIVKGMLSLRYRIKIKNFDALYKAGYHKDGGVLFLPNHPAEADPIIISTLLAADFRPRPLVIEHFYYLPGAHFFMKLFRALPMPNFDMSANSWKIRQVEKSLDQVDQALKGHDNFLIYPSARLKLEAKEVVGGSSYIHRILEKNPKTKIVLIRTTGLWGSISSRAITGKSPDFWKMITLGIKVILKNGLFFAPRRKVTVEFALAPDDFPYKAERLELNRYLEKWYNRYEDKEGNEHEEEPLKLVSFSRFSKEFPKITKKKKEEKKDKIKVSKEVRREVIKELARLSSRPFQSIQEESELSKDLGLDSLDFASIQAFLDERYHAQSIVPEEMQTVEDVLQLTRYEEKEEKEFEKVDKRPYAWPKETLRPDIAISEGATIQEVFLRSCDRMKNGVACGDEQAKYFTYKKFKRAVCVLAEKFRSLPDTHIGVLLPSSAGVFIVVFAILLARKTPVMLNWTTGERNLSFAKDLLKLKTVFSARRFLERVDHLELGKVDESLVLLEDFRRTLKLRDKLKGVFLSLKKAPLLLKHFQIDQVKPSDPAVILFTSGTETFPKAVPLSHTNLIENIKAGLTMVKLNRDDIALSVLPPFHSFGFTVSGMVPLLAGYRAFYSPDPTDSHVMARECYLRNITMICCAPSFYRNLFRVASPKHLKTVRMFVTGAEKAPKELFEAVEKLGKNRLLMEGYGITECSPMVTIRRPEKGFAGVGKPLPGIKLCTIHPESKEKLPDHEEGEVCIHGPNVFEGYLGKDAPNPFIELDGERWYRSGDLGKIDEEGNLIFSGRIKRFVKIGGEMVSLGALEEELTEASKTKGWIEKDEDEPQLAVGAIEEGEKPKVVLFATFTAKVEEINAILQEKGFGRIVKIQEVRQISHIPMTGTGKVHFRRINEMLSEPHDT